MNKPKVSILTLNWNSFEDTIECLESLKKITYPNYEVIVVDNGSKGNEAQASHWGIQESLLFQGSRLEAAFLGCRLKVLKTTLANLA